jgi:tRNA A37 N6-isopentenylltransferase MiaA
MPSKKPALILIVGPTAVGKTELAIQLAERLDERAFMNVYN